MPFPRYWFQLSLVTLTYFSLGWLGNHLLQISLEPSPIWFPAGIGLTAILVWGEKQVLGIFLGDLCLGLTLSDEITLIFGSAIGSSLTAVLGSRLLNYFRFSLRLNHIRDVLLLVFGAGFMASTVNASLDTLSHFLSGGLTWMQFRQHWGILWLGDIVGICVLTPFLLRLKYDRLQIGKKNTDHLLEAIICNGLLLIIGWIVFGCEGIKPNLRGATLSNVQYLEYLPFPFVVWASLRFPIWGAVIANLLVSLLASVGMLKGVGPFLVQSPNLNDGLLLLQIFLIIVTTTSLFLSAAVSEREEIDNRLRSTLERENLLAGVGLRVYQSLEISRVFQTTVEEIRDFLEADQVYIAYLENNGSVKVMAESLLPHIPSFLDWQPEPEIINVIKDSFQLNRVIVDTDRINNIPHLQNYYRELGIQSYLSIPLQIAQQQLGILTVHNYTQRPWQKVEIRLLEQLAAQVSIAIQKAQLYQRVQKLNSNLEQEVEERTLELREKMEELQNLYEMKTVFLQAVSHDMRTAIMGLLMILKNSSSRCSSPVTLTRPLLKKIIESTERQLTLINAISEHHFSEYRPVNLNCQQVSLQQLVNSWINDWQDCLRNNQATIYNLIDHDLPPVQIDPCQLKCVFEQLLNNSLKHNQPGLNLIIDAKLQEGMVYCTFTDNGSGMTESQCQNLFKLYVRSLHNQRLTGIGLGSYQCRQIIEAHGGKIGVNSTPDVGSEFWFTLPIAKSITYPKNLLMLI